MSAVHWLYIIYLSHLYFWWTFQFSFPLGGISYGEHCWRAWLETDPGNGINFCFRKHLLWCSKMLNWTVTHRLQNKWPGRICRLQVPLPRWEYELNWTSKLAILFKICQFDKSRHCLIQNQTIRSTCLVLYWDIYYIFWDAEYNGDDLCLLMTLLQKSRRII